MKVNLEKIEKNKLELTIEVEADRFSQALDQAYRQVVKKIDIPGFRKGKVPRAILEAQFGKGVLYDDAMEKLLPQTYAEAIKENGIEPIDQPEKVDFVQVEVGQDVIYKAIVEVKPEVNLGEYKGLELEKKVAEVTDEDVAQELERLRSRHAQLVTIEDGAVEKGDIVTIDFSGYIDNEPFEGGSSKEYSLTIGSGSFIPGFEDQLIDARLGEEKDVNVPFPEDYNKEDLAGKPVLFKVSIKGIKRKQLAELDDEFAKDVSEFESLEELKADLANKLKAAAEETANRSLKNQAVSKAVEAAGVEIPAKMVDQRVNQMINEFDQHLRSQGLALDKYMEFTNKNIDELKEGYQEQAANLVKTDLVLEAIAKAEDLKPTPEEIDIEINKLAEMFKQEAVMLRGLLEAQGSVDSMARELSSNKTIDFIIQNAKILQ